MFNPMDMSGKRILVTGASSGIGKATAIYLSKLGARLVISGRNSQRLEETHSVLDGEEHTVAPFDITNVDEIPTWMKEIATDGALHGLVHSAGIQVTIPVRGLTQKAFDEIINVNLTTAFGLVKGFRQKKVNAKGGSIVLLSSVMGVVGQPGVSAYCASKAALTGFAKSVALEYARENIRVNCLLPGHVRTEMAKRLEDSLTEKQFESIISAHPLGLGRPDDIAAAAAFLIADTGRWITGSNLIIDGGYTAQ